MKHDDLAAVREFRAGLDEPREGALVRGRWELAGAAAPERARPRRIWMLATAGAAVAVAVVVGAAAAVQTPQQPPEQVTVSAGSTPTPSVVDLPVTHGTKAPMNPAVMGRPGGDHAQAVEALTRIAAKQTGGPLAIGSDQVLYVKSYSLTDGEGRYIHELWMDVQTGTALRIRRNDDGPRVFDRTMSQAEIDEDEARSAGTPPGLHNINGAYVAAFPSAQPEALAASWKTWAQQDYPGRAADPLIFKQLHEVFHYADPLLTAAQRSTFYLALTYLPSVKATTATIAGTQYDVVCVSGQAQGTQCALFDSATGRYAGDAGTGTDMVVKLGHFTFVDFAAQPRPVPGAPVVPQEKKGPSGSATTPKR
ncbi:hypothetical protein OHA72_14355 [Dactylosporangium sp. NBC_01737]|uniref:hypothetical protein n=1 Tax=Dactylosporangium sp. NBC_01737 TaxID=2975959 RepID=UPI002E104353|nr:hypothetical protein OHA72_14355 [Dactylosporangium sp. NBC_01737]